MKMTQLGLVREFREVLPPASEEGAKAARRTGVGLDDHLTADDFAKGLPIPEQFGPSTLILSAGDAVWEFKISRSILCRLKDATLRIETVRTHGMLHSRMKGTTASIFVNDRLVDKIHLVKAHPHGEDFGIDSRRPFPIWRDLDAQRDAQTVRIQVDPEASWDIDRVSIDMIVTRREITPGAWMIAGAALSVAMGALLTALMS
jgi:hypothetical protein